ncbi:hypothetical protein OG875_00365 [Streptomyces sp. NBC_01498]|uniref:hypothetical protein n=1 Tax=Streptomyces sp. NBC_01498 TaxID=2975870 RepID=UPI002E7B0D2D|nr:hypothetical protein [Streptomyces sp. NBC_01498]WTL23183.1 hypothetical protein OG875_00365 [Streptomyces sp. NBC_01498]
MTGTSMPSTPTTAALLVAAAALAPAVLVLLGRLTGRRLDALPRHRAAERDPDDPARGPF